MRIREMSARLKVYPKTERIWYVMYCRKSTESKEKQVQSIPDQERILTELADTYNLPILQIFREKKSAKSPGRPVFEEMVKTIEQRQDVKGVIAWNVSRLSRNPKDTGTLQWLLQIGTIEEIRTPSKTYTEVDSDFVMAVEGAQANRFIKDLCKDTKRGLQSKLDKGMFPGLAPVGYQNDTTKKQGERDIVPHKTYFRLVREVFRQALTGNYSLAKLHFKAQELGIITHKGNLISKNQTVAMLKNPFYAGRFWYTGKLHQGSHKPMITEEEYDLLQEIISGRSKPRSISKDLTFTGLMRCGECGLMITGEEHSKTYRNGKSQTFTYYRCTKKKGKCSQPYINEKELERQVLEVLSTLSLNKRIVEWAIKWLNESNEEQKKLREDKYQALKLSLKTTITKLDSLLELKLSPHNTTGHLLTDEEFMAKKQTLLMEKNKIEGQLFNLGKHVEEWLELTSQTFDFTTKAYDKFLSGTKEEKRTILRTIGSNLTLKDIKVDISIRTPFVKIQTVVEGLKENSWLEPKKSLSLQAKALSFQEKSLVGNSLDEVRTYYRSLDPQKLHIYATLLQNSLENPLLTTSLSH